MVPSLPPSAYRLPIGQRPHIGRQTTEIVRSGGLDVARSGHRDLDIAAAAMQEKCMTTPRVRTLGVVLFPEFELLDVFGPLEVFGNRLMRDTYRVLLVAEHAGSVASAQIARAIADHGFDDCPPLDVLLVPGGGGTRREVENAALLAWLRARAADAELVTSVCTGAALLARAGVLDGRRATTNKFAFDWVVSQGPQVEWIHRARWVEDGKFVTSSGVSAGIDMALHVVARTVDAERAEMVARLMEYTAHTDADDDPFAALYPRA
jgi:transcriptional regulator GlxA family with amidase domain